MRKATLIILIAILAAFSLFFHFYSEKHKIYRYPFLGMGTIIEIETLSPISETQREEIMKLVNKYEYIFSSHLPSSFVSRINFRSKKGITKFELTPELEEIIFKSLKVARLTGGAFDITVKPLIDKWKEAFFKKKVPSNKEIRDIMKIVGYKFIKIKNRKLIFCKKGMNIDLGGIAKGFIIDKLISYLKREWKVENILINAGGDIVCDSKKYYWKIGIRHPFFKDRLITMIKIKKGAIFTSGDYERFFIIKNKKYTHIINPFSGYPEKNIRSATVIGEDPAIADGLATAFCILTPKKSLKIADSLKVGVLIITGTKEKFRLYTNKYWKRFIYE